jgi:hypothetical protein
MLCIPGHSSFIVGPEPKARLTGVKTRKPRRLGARGEAPALCAGAGRAGGERPGRERGQELTGAPYATLGRRPCPPPHLVVTLRVTEAGTERGISNIL